MIFHLLTPAPSDIHLVVKFLSRFRPKLYSKISVFEVRGQNFKVDPSEAEEAFQRVMWPGVDKKPFTVNTLAYSIEHIAYSISIDTQCIIKLSNSAWKWVWKL